MFGIAPDKTIWHKFSGFNGWEPNHSFENLSSTAYGYPVAVSWGPGRTDYFYLGDKNAAFHKYFDGEQWKPEGKDGERLEGEFTSGLAASTWGPDRLDIVGRNKKNGYSHKAWAYDHWVPEVTQWEDFGGNFSSAPTVVSWSQGRVDIFGIDAAKGSIKHKYHYGGENWEPVNSWEDLGGGPFIGDPLATSWGPDRFDIWAVGKDGQLNHKYWFGDRYSEWETLGGNFSTAPQVVHREHGKIDIIGRFRNDSHYHSQAFDGEKWVPSYGGWWDKGGDFAGNPAVVAQKDRSKQIFPLDFESCL